MENINEEEIFAESMIDGFNNNNSPLKERMPSIIIEPNSQGENLYISPNPLPEQNINLNDTEYFSVESRISEIEINNLNRIENKTPITVSKPIKNIQDIKSNENYIENYSIADSFDSIIVNKGLFLPDNQHDKDFELMKEYINNNDYEKIRELDRKITQKEIAKRRIENTKRLEKLKKLEEKLVLEVKRKPSAEKAVVPNLNFANLPINDNTNKNFPKLCLANTTLGGGWYVYLQEEIMNNYYEHKFCDYIFYTKK